jgi:fumarylpyruvate hydrolase
MTTWAFPPPPVPALPVAGSDALYAVARIFCVGRNYADHAAEMGNVIDTSGPFFFFTKSPSALVPGGGALPYPPGTSDYHHEVELVLALGAPAFRVSADAATAAIWAYGVGIDLTRRDLQARAKERRQPWDAGKDVEHSAVVGPLVRAAAFGPVGSQRIALAVNGVARQAGRLSDMVWGVGSIVAHLSTLYHLGPGDLIFTGTPAGVGALQPGDTILAEIDGLPPISSTISAAV